MQIEQTYPCGCKATLDEHRSKDGGPVILGFTPVCAQARSLGARPGVTAAREHFWSQEDEPASQTALQQWKARSNA